MKTFVRFMLVLALVAVCGAFEAQAQTHNCVITDTLKSEETVEPGVVKKTTQVTWVCDSGTTFTVTTHVWYENGEESYWAQTAYYWPTGGSGQPVWWQVGTSNDPYNVKQSPYWSGEPVDNECLNCG